MESDRRLQVTVPSAEPVVRVAASAIPAMVATVMLARARAASVPVEGTPVCCRARGGVVDRAVAPVTVLNLPKASRSARHTILLNTHLVRLPCLLHELSVERHVTHPPTPIELDPIEPILGKELDVALVVDVPPCEENVGRQPVGR